MWSNLKFFNQMYLHYIKTYAMVGVVVMHLPFLIMLIWAEVST